LHITGLQLYTSRHLRLSALWGAAGHDDKRACTGQLFGCSQADTGTATQDKRSLPLQHQLTASVYFLDAAEQAL
jgi:hypothetical protein